MNKAQKRLALDALVSPRPPSLGGGFGGEPLLSAADEASAAAMLLRLDLEETQLDALRTDLRQSLTPQSTPSKDYSQQKSLLTLQQPTLNLDIVPQSSDAHTELQQSPQKLALPAMPPMETPIYTAHPKPSTNDTPISALRAGARSQKKRLGKTRSLFPNLHLTCQYS